MIFYFRTKILKIVGIEEKIKKFELEKFQKYKKKYFT